jgi:Domain of unknown function (DUF397)
MPNNEAVPTTAGQAAAPQEPAPAWRKARRSGAENGGCVEVLGGLPGLAGIRDSRRPHDGAHFVPAAAFAAFLADAKAGAYDMKPRPAQPASPGQAE